MTKKDKIFLCSLNAYSNVVLMAYSVVDIFTQLTDKNYKVFDLHVELLEKTHSPKPNIPDIKKQLEKIRIELSKQVPKFENDSN